MIDRRSVVTALASSAAVGGSVAGGVADDATLLAPVRRFLGHAVKGTVAEYLRGEGASAPSLSPAQGFPRLAPGAEQLPPGSYIVWPAQSRVDARVALADGTEGSCRFFLIQARLARAELGAPAASPFFVSVAAHSALGRLEQDCTSAVQSAYDALVAAGGGTLFFPPGDYRFTLRLTARTVHLKGAGMGATRLRPARGDQPVLQGLYNSGVWDTVSIQDLDLVGTGQGVGFRAGHRPYAAGDEFAGRTSFTRVGFDRFTTAIDRPSGQIGLWLDSCRFDAAEYHLVCHDHASPGEPMHAGVTVARSCHFSGASKAVARISGKVSGSGQILLDTCIFEENPGFVLLVDGLNNEDATPALVLRSCWSEKNATAGTVNIDGQSFSPAFAALSNTGMVLAEDTPIGSVSLRNATLATLHCPLDAFRIISTDAHSTVTHQQARGFGSYQPEGRVLSVAAAYQFLPNRALSFPMPPRTQGRRAGPSEQLLLAQTRGPLRLAGKALPDRRWLAEAGEKTRLIDEISVDADSWLVWLFHYRLLAGTAARLDLTGGVGIGAAPLRERSKTCLAGMTHLPEGGASLSFYLSGPPEGHSEVEVGPVNLVRFATRQAALDFLNADYWLEQAA